MNDVFLAGIVPFWQIALVQSFGAALAVYAAALIHGTKHSIALFDSGVGFLSWFLYAMLYHRPISNFTATLVASLFVGLVAQCASRHFQAPVTLFIIPSLYPLVPGALLYRTVTAFMVEQIDAAASNALQTVMVAIAIALGLLLVETGDLLWKSARRKIDTLREDG